MSSYNEKRAHRASQPLATNNISSINSNHINNSAKVGASIINNNETISLEYLSNNRNKKNIKKHSLENEENEDDQDDNNEVFVDKSFAAQTLNKKQNLNDSDNSNLYEKNGPLNQNKNNSSVQASNNKDNKLFYQKHASTPHLWSEKLTDLNNTNNKTDLSEDNLYLNNLKASNNNHTSANRPKNLNNNASSINLSNSPSETIDKPYSSSSHVFQPLASSSAAKQINKSIPEKLFSARHIINQKHASNKNLQNIVQQNETTTTTNGVDSDGSEILHFRSTSVKSTAQQQQQPGANYLTNIDQSSLSNSDPNRSTILTSNNTNNIQTITTTTLLNNTSKSVAGSATNLASNDKDLDDAFYTFTNSYANIQNAVAAAAASNNVNSNNSSSMPKTKSTKHYKSQEPLSAIQIQEQILLQQQLGGIFHELKKEEKLKPTTTQSTSNQPYSDGTVSDSALTNTITNMADSGGAAGGAQTSGAPVGNKKGRRPSMAKALVILGLSKKSNSASNLAYGKRIGFARVSEEYGVLPELRNRNFSPSTAGSGNESGAEEKRPKLWSGALKLPHELPFSTFIDNLGPGQKVSRQALGLPCHGEIKMSLFVDKGKMNIEIIQVKNLKHRAGYRMLPSEF